jgi:hypothetical protein
MVITDDKDVPAIDLGGKTIVKLHGDMDSASSMVISKPDYTRYKTSHKGFVEWLNAIVAQNTVLFLGTSFDDPRLNDADGHVLGLFGDFRRQPFILLKSPQKDGSAPEEDFEIDLADFEACCEDFRDRGFFVVPIDHYGEIPDILQDVQTRALERKRQSDMSGFESGRILQADHLAVLEKNLRGLLDEKTLQLSEHVFPSENPQIVHHALRVGHDLVVIGGARLTFLAPFRGARPIEQLMRQTPVNLIA